MELGPCLNQKPYNRALGESFLWGSQLICRFLGLHKQGDTQHRLVGWHGCGSRPCGRTLPKNEMYHPSGAIYQQLKGLWFQARICYTNLILMGDREREREREYIYIYVHIHIYIYIATYAYAYTCICVCVYSCMCISVYMRVCLCHKPFQGPFPALQWSKYTDRRYLPKTILTMLMCKPRMSYHQDYG